MNTCICIGAMLKWMNTHIHTYIHTYTLSLSLSHTHTHTHTHTPSHTYIYTHTHTHTLSLSLSHTHNSLSQTHTPSHTLSLTHTHTHTKNVPPSACCGGLELRWLRMAVRMVLSPMLCAHWARPSTNSSLQQNFTSPVCVSGLKHQSILRWVTIHTTISFRQNTVPLMNSDITMYCLLISHYSDIPTTIQQYWNMKLYCIKLVMVVAGLFQHTFVPLPLPVSLCLI